MISCKVNNWLNNSHIVLNSELPVNFTPKTKADTRYILLRYVRLHNVIFTKQAIGFDHQVLRVQRCASKLL